MLQMVGGSHLSALKSSGSPGTYLPTLVQTMRSSRGSPFSARPRSCSTNRRAVVGWTSGRCLPRMADAEQDHCMELPSSPDAARSHLCSSWGCDSHPLSIAAGIEWGHIKEVEAILFDSQMHSCNCLILIWALQDKAALAEMQANSIAGGLKAVVGIRSPLTPYAWPKGLHPRPTTEHCTPVLPNACRGRAAV